MNNKGMTLVELIITFSLLMIIIVGLFNLILDAKLDLDNKQIVKDVSQYSDLLNNDIHYDLIITKPFAIAIKQSSESNWVCGYSKNYSNYNEDTSCSVSNSTLSVNAYKTIGSQTVNIIGSQSLDICGEMYPCAIYAYYDTGSGLSSDSVSAKFKSIAINKDITDSNKEFGIKYGNTFEAIPNQKYINTSNMVANMTLDNDFFVISYPIYITGDDFDYGFKIAYPFEFYND